MFFFDLDSTLVDTRELVLRAYEAAGVLREHVLPGVPAMQFLKEAGYRAKDVIGDKNAAYVEIIRNEGVQTLPAFEVFTSLKPACRGICTGASMTSVNAVLHAVNVPTWALKISAAAAVAVKPHLLSAVLDARGYVDDDASTSSGCRVRGVEWFNAADVDRMKRWAQLQSYWQPVRTRAFR